MRLTIVCAAALIADANHLAMVLGYSPANATTYGDPAWTDADGNLYAVASLPVSDSFVATALTGLSRPDWDVDEIVDMVAAGRAQAALVFWTPEGETEQPRATPDMLTACAGDQALSVLAGMGVTRVS